jgi:hypothetical protein
LLKDDDTSKIVEDINFVKPYVYWYELDVLDEDNVVVDGITGATGPYLQMYINIINLVLVELKV